MATTSSTPIPLQPKTQEGIVEFYNQAASSFNGAYNLRSTMEEIDRAYQREEDYTVEHLRAKQSNRTGDSSRIQNLRIPVVKPLVEAAVTYQTSVFLTGLPIFEISAVPEYMDEAMQMNTLMEDHSIRGQWVSQLLRHFRNGFKYNLAALEVDWCRRMVPSLETDLSFNKSQAKPTEIAWEGNTIKNLDLYNSFWDTRVDPLEVAEYGEFFGYTRTMSRIALKKFIAALPERIIANVTKAFESGVGGTRGNTFYIPEINPRALIDKDNSGAPDWMSWAGLTGSTHSNIQYRNQYELTTLYARILPSDFNMRVPSANTPQVWKFIFVNHQVLIYAERQTNAHDLIPILFSQPYDDGLGYQTKSLADDVKPMQDISSALASSWLASRRRAISDRILYDPSRVAKQHIESPNPTARIPVKPSAYGKPLSEAVYPFPFRDDQAQVALSEMQQVQQFAYQLSGQNAAKQGQFVKGNKTQQEYADVMNHSNGNDQKTALLYEDQLFTPLKEILKINILQYQGAQSLLSRAKKASVSIDPVALRKAILNFKVSDGLAPTDKQMDADSYQVAMQVIGSSPEINSGYNLAPLFSYMMKLKGADLSTFEKSPQQIAYEQALQSWQSLAQLAIEKGQQFQQPQPKPQDYGYDPNTQGSSAAAAPAPQEATKINNITNNITNTETGA